MVSSGGSSGNGTSTNTVPFRFAHITDSREEGMRFAENARYQSRLASSLRRRQEVMKGTVLVDVPFPDEPPLESIYDNLLIGDVETVAEKLVAEIHATKPVHVCFSATRRTRRRCARWN